MTQPRGLGGDRGSTRTVAALLAVLAVLGPLTTDLYLPAFPRMAADLSATASDMQWSLSATLIGLAAGQLLFGPASDAFGRRAPLVTAACLHVAASAGIALVEAVGPLLALRFLQGLGGAGMSVLALAIARDSFDGRRLVRMLARLALLSGLAPVAAPAVGSVLLRAGGWRGVFVALALYGVVAVGVSVTALPALERTRVRPARPESAAGRYASVLSDRRLLGAGAISAMAVAGVFAYVSASSFIFQGGYGLSADAYAIVFGVNASAFAIGAQVAARLILRWGPEPVLYLTLTTVAGSGIGAVAVASLDLGVIGFASAMFVFLLAAGASMPTVQLIALRRHAERAGTASSVLGLVNFGFAALISPLSSLVDEDAVVVLGVMLVAMASAGLLVLRLVAKSHGARHDGWDASVAGPPSKEVNLRSL